MTGAIRTDAERLRDFAAWLLSFADRLEPLEPVALSWGGGALLWSEEGMLLA